MGRGNRELALNSARQLLFGPRRARTVVDQTAIIEAALVDLDKGLSGAAIVFLRNNKSKIGSDESVDGLLAAVARRSIDEVLPEVEGRSIGERDPFSYFDKSIRANPDAATFSFDSDEAELDFVAQSLSSDLIGQIEDDVASVSLDRDAVIDTIFAAPQSGSLAARILTQMSEDERLIMLQRLVQSKVKSPLVNTLREQLTYQLIEGAEEPSRDFLSRAGFESLWSDKTTYLRRGGNHATLLHLYQDQATLCGKSTGYRPNAIRRGAWRDAVSASGVKRCPKCEKAMPSDFFSPREDSWQHSILNEEEYNKVHRRADRFTRALLESSEPLDEARFLAAKENIAKQYRETENRALARYLYKQLENEKTRQNSLRQLSGYASYNKLVGKLSYDHNRIKLPTERQLYAALKNWPDDDADQVEEKMARLLYRVNGRKLPDGIFS